MSCIGGRSAMVGCMDGPLVTSKSTTGGIEVSGAMVCLCDCAILRTPRCPSEQGKQQCKRNCF